MQYNNARMLRIKRSNKKQVLSDMRALLLKRLLEYQTANRVSHVDMAEKAGISRSTWFRWVKGTTSIPQRCFGTLIYRFNLDQHEILDVPRKTDMRYKEFFDYAEEYDAYMAADKPKAALQIMRRAGAAAFDVLHAYEFSADCVITNRIPSLQDLVSIIIYMGSRKYMLELSPGARLTYKFYASKKDSRELLHEGCFSHSILKAVIAYLDSKRVMACNKRKKEELSITNLLKKSRELEYKQAYER